MIRSAVLLASLALFPAAAIAQPTTPAPTPAPSGEWEYDGPWATASSTLGLLLGTSGTWVLGTDGLDVYGAGSTLTFSSSGAWSITTSGALTTSTGQGSMMPGKPKPPTDKYGYFFAAYGVVWLALLGYLFLIASRVKGFAERVRRP